ncbi:MAG: hypothetical protein ACREJQ_03780 [bacterium]
MPQERWLKPAATFLTYRIAILDSQTNGRGPTHAGGLDAYYNEVNRESQRHSPSRLMTSEAPSVQDAEILDLLSHLVDRSLVVFEETAHGGRFLLLDSIRQYALDRLNESGETDAIRGRHMDFHLILAEDVGHKIRGERQHAFLDIMDAENDNFRAALDWCAAHTGSGPASFRWVSALWYYWYLRGNLSLGRKQIERVLSQSPTQARADDRANALRGAIDIPMPPSKRTQHEGTLAKARASLGVTAFDSSFAEGTSLPLDAAIAYALRPDWPCYNL